MTDWLVFFERMVLRMDAIISVVILFIHLMWSNVYCF